MSSAQHMSPVRQRADAIMQSTSDPFALYHHSPRNRAACTHAPPVGHAPFCSHPPAPVPRGHAAPHIVARASGASLASDRPTTHYRTCGVRVAPRPTASGRVSRVRGVPTHRPLFPRARFPGFATGSRAVVVPSCATVVARAHMSWQGLFIRRSHSPSPIP